MENNLQIEWIETSAITGYELNAKRHPPKQIKQIAQSIKEFGFLQPLVLDKNNIIVVGHGRLLGAKEAGLEKVPMLRAEHLTPEQVKAYRIADNKLNESEWNLPLLHQELKELELGSFDITLTGFDKKFVTNFEIEKAKLADIFLVPPFSVLDTRLAEWQNRKKIWRELIGDAGESRDGVLSGVSETDLDTKCAMAGLPSASLFDPVLAEVLCRWFTNDGYRVFDPFAGGTFGYVAGKLGLDFIGIELRKEQAELNQARCEKESFKVRYVCDDALNLDAHVEDDSQDFIFTCPPYADLEKYSNDPRDLSNMSHEQFLQAYETVLGKTYRKLKQNRFAAIVVSEVRRDDGTFLGLVPKTIEIMQRAGYNYYNECVLINAIGTLPMRAGRVMNSTRKVGRMHQNVLVFFKGAPAEVKANFLPFTKYEQSL